MSLADIVGLIKDILTILALLVGSGFAIFVFFHFAPTLQPRILPSWPNKESQGVILRLEVENKSRIRVFKDTIYLQVLEHKIEEGGFLSEGVPFEEHAIIPSEKPIQWREPVEIFQTTKGLDPGDILVVERLYYCPPNTILHVGLQVRTTLSFFGRIAARIGGREQRWTTTRIVMR